MTLDLFPDDQVSAPVRRGPTPEAPRKYPSRAEAMMAVEPLQARFGFSRVSAHMLRRTGDWVILRRVEQCLVQCNDGRWRVW